MKLRWPKSSSLFGSILQIITPSPEKKTVLQESHLGFSFQKKRGFGFIQRTVCANTESGLFYFACVLPPSSLLMLFLINYQKFLWRPHYFTCLCLVLLFATRDHKYTHTHIFSEKKLNLECSNVRWLYCIPLIPSWSLFLWEMLSFEKSSVISVSIIWWYLDSILWFRERNAAQTWLITASHCSDLRD